MNRPAAAALAALLFGVLAGRASAETETRVSGTVLTAEVGNDPFADNVSGAGNLTIADKTGHTESYSVLGTTRLTRDGKPIVFDSTLVGDMVVKATFDPATKLLTVLELKSAAAATPWTKGAPKAAKNGKKAAAPAKTSSVSGEVAFADAIKGELSVRTGKGATRRFSVVDATKVVRETAGKPDQEVGFETVAVGEGVEVRSRDGKTADEIRVRAAAR